MAEVTTPIPIDKIPPKLLEALRERGHDDAALAHMTPHEMCREYAAWHLGDPAWGSDFYLYATRLNKVAGVTSD